MLFFATSEIVVETLELLEILRRSAVSSDAS